jgi:hypothetical protein
VAAGDTDRLSSNHLKFDQPGGISPQQIGVHLFMNLFRPPLAAIKDGNR